MIRLVYYVIYQIITKLYGKIQIRIKNNIGYIINTKSISKELTFVFDFNNMNLGDCFFYSLLIFNLNNNGYKLEIHLSKEKKQIYDKIVFLNSKNIKYKNNLIDYNNFSKKKILISSIWSVKLKYIRNLNYLLFDCTDTRIKNRIAEHIYHSTINELKLNTGKVYKFIEYKFDQEINHKLQNVKYVIFSEEINSGFHRINKKKINKLTFLLNQIKSDIELIKVGKYKSELKLSRKFTDFGGKLEINEILNLINNPNCLCVLGFDTFFMHFSSILGKNTNIVIRKFSKKYTNFIKNKLFPIYNINNNSINFYE